MKFTRIVVTIIYILVGCVGCQISPTTFRGQVINSNTSEPIHRAKVSLQLGADVPINIQTDNEGIYTFEFIMNSDEINGTITVIHDSYKSYDAYITVKKNQLQLQKIQLNPIETSMFSNLTSDPTPTPSSACDLRKSGYERTLDDAWSMVSNSSAQGELTQLQQLAEQGQSAVIMFKDAGYQGMYQVYIIEDLTGIPNIQESWGKAWNDEISSLIFINPGSDLILTTYKDSGYFRDPLEFCGTSAVGNFEDFVTSALFDRTLNDDISSFDFSRP